MRAMAPGLRAGRFVAAAMLLLAAARVSSGGPALDAASRTALRHALEDPDRGVRYAAAGALGKAGREAASEADLLAGSLHDPEWCVRHEAARALSRIGPAAARPLAESLAATHYGRLEHARTVFARLGPDGAPAVPALVALSLLDSPDARVRAHAAMTWLGLHGGKFARSPFISDPGLTPAAER